MMVEQAKVSEELKDKFAQYLVDSMSLEDLMTEMKDSIIARLDSESDADVLNEIAEACPEIFKE